MPIGSQEVIVVAPDDWDDDLSSANDYDDDYFDNCDYEDWCSDDFE